jgi:NAD(P)H-hydrate epimerase
LKLIPQNTILTPHPGEFARLTESTTTGYKMHLNAIEFAKKYQVIIILKGAFSQIVFPDGKCSFNSTILAL